MTSSPAHFINNGGYRYLNNVCINVTRDYVLSGSGTGEGINGVDVLIDVCAEIGDQGPGHATTTIFGAHDVEDSGDFTTSNRISIFRSDIIIANGNLEHSQDTLTVCDVDVKCKNDGARRMAMRLRFPY